MAKIEVDLDTLQELSSQLSQVSSLLQDAGEIVSSFDGQLGLQLEGALGDFISGWKDGRNSIIKDVNGLEEKVKGAISLYEQNEARLVKAANGGSGSSSPAAGVPAPAPAPASAGHP